MPKLAMAVASLLASALHAQSVNVVVLDDVGRLDLDGLIASGRAPNLAHLAESGFRFRNAQAMPLCQESRRTIDFGNFDVNGTGSVCSGSLAIPASQVSLAEHCAVPSAFFGKWHEGANPTGGPWPLAPQAHGWGTWRAGVAEGVAECGSHDYFNWLDVEDGTATFLAGTYQPAVQYARWSEWWTVSRGPRLSMFAIPLAHAPYQRPPSAWLPASYPATPSPRDKYEAMIVACDGIVGRMLARMAPSDVLIVVGDNGTPGGLLGSFRAKGTTFERGINVPLLVYGRGFRGSSDALVHVVDLYATAAELLGIPTGDAVDSRSLVPLMLGSERPVHPFVLCGAVDRNLLVNDVCARSLRFKLRRTTEGEEFYDLQTDPQERRNRIRDEELAPIVAAHRSWLDEELGSTALHGPDGRQRNVLRESASLAGD